MANIKVKVQIINTREIIKMVEADDLDEATIKVMSNSEHNE
jgi:hypothetical protein